MPRDILFFADSHLREDRGDSKYALRQIIDYAIKNKVGAVVGAGDLIDRQKNRSAPIAFFFSQLDRLEEREIPFYYIQGQHDFDDPPWLSGHRRSEHLHDREVICDDAILYGLDCLPEGELQRYLDTIPDNYSEVGILVAHQVWGDWMGSVTVPQGTFSQIPVFNTAVTGDYHKIMTAKTLGKNGQPLTVYSPGATCMQKINEPHEHSFLVRSKGQFRRIKLNSRPFIDWPLLLTPEQLDVFAEDFERVLADAAHNSAEACLPEPLQTPFLRVTYSYRLPDTVRRVEKLVRGRAHLFWKELPPEEKTATAVAVGAIDYDVEITPLSELSSCVDKDSDPEVFSLLSAMLTVSDKELAFSTWKTKFLEDSAQD